MACKQCGKISDGYYYRLLSQTEYGMFCSLRCVKEWEEVIKKKRANREHDNNYASCA